MTQAWWLLPVILVLSRMKQRLTDPTWRVLDQPGISLQDTDERQQMEKRWKRRRKGGSSRKGREGEAGRKEGDRKKEEAGGRKEEIVPVGIRRHACPICGCSNEKS